jgi:uridine kinase
MAAKEIIFVEGLFTLWWPELRTLFDLKVFVDVYVEPTRATADLIVPNPGDVGVCVEALARAIEEVRYSRSISAVTDPRTQRR